MFHYRDIADMLRDPIVSTGLLAVVSAMVTRILPRDHPTGRLVGQLLFFAALTAPLLHHGIVPYEIGPSEASSLERVFISSAKAGSSPVRASPARSRR